MYSPEFLSPGLRIRSGTRSRLLFPFAAAFPILYARATSRVCRARARRFLRHATLAPRQRCCPSWHMPARVERQPIADRLQRLTGRHPKAVPACGAPVARIGRAPWWRGCDFENNAPPADGASSASLYLAEFSSPSPDRVRKAHRIWCHPAVEWWCAAPRVF